MGLPDGRLYTTPSERNYRREDAPFFTSECDCQSKFSIILKTILDKQDEVVSIDGDVFDFAQAQLVSFLFLPFFMIILKIFSLLLYVNHILCALFFR